MYPDQYPGTVLCVLLVCSDIVGSGLEFHVHCRHNTIDGNLSARGEGTGAGSQLSASVWVSCDWFTTGGGITESYRLGVTKYSFDDSPISFGGMIALAEAEEKNLGSTTTLIKKE